MEVLELKREIETLKQTSAIEKDKIVQEFMKILEERNEKTEKLMKSLITLNEVNQKLIIERERLINYINKSDSIGGGNAQKEKKEKEKAIKQLEVVQAQMSLLEKDNVLLRKQAEEYERIIREQESRIKTVENDKNEMTEKNERENRSLQFKISQLEEEISQLSSNNRSNILEQENAQLKEQMQNWESQVQEIIDERDLELKNSKQENQLLVEHIESLEEKIQVLSQQKTQPSNESSEQNILLVEHIESLEVQINQLKNENSQLENENKLLKQTNRSQPQNNKGADEIHQENLMLVQHIDTLEAKIEELQQDNNELVQRLESSDFKSNFSENPNLQNKINELESQMEFLIQENENLRKNQGKSGDSDNLLLVQHIEQLEQKITSLELEKQNLLLATEELNQQLEDEKENNELLVKHIEELGTQSELSELSQNQLVSQQDSVESTQHEPKSIDESETSTDKQHEKLTPHDSIEPDNDPNSALKKTTSTVLSSEKLSQNKKVFLSRSGVPLFAGSIKLNTTSSKKKRFGGGWKTRWMAVWEGFLCFFKSKNDEEPEIETRIDERTRIRKSPNQKSKNDNVIEVIAKNETYEIKVKNIKEYDHWISILEKSRVI
ncbi:cop1-interactive protein [Anaeramoeba ignava]|uniref:Cop1-interactive protein n=1 Tax=Anaeramoeba ignava TaxID=1746090 RepID=A0A9Q0LRS6_ANAIG|nr:cop1-interactive protein [Anaeramoeba ignava]|eukprot:Anaeramoba_ignava/a21_38.p1 GENE.a21_38~~a21_38.p1  ORF type:complete len:611 (-),score=250.97 a21_38:46-1878(-)